MRTRTYWKRFFISTFCTILSLTSLKVWGEWMPGIIHIHTTFSDGSDDIPQRVDRAKKEGCRFIIITDHYEQIDNLDKKAYEGGAGTDYGFEDYFRNCREQTIRDFVTIAGAEIESQWMPELSGEQTAYSHLLALRIKPENHVGWKINSKIKEIQCQLSAQSAIAERVRDFDWIPVAAHPNLISSIGIQWKFWEGRNSCFDFRVPTTLDKLQGIEMFNTETVKQQENLVISYLGWLADGRKFFVTSGCDSHNWTDAADLLLKTPHQLVAGISLEVLRKYLVDSDNKRWTRKTWVYVDNFNQVGILDAIKEGKTYATQYGARLENLNYNPSLSLQSVDRPKFQFTVAFSQAITSGKTVRIYRDGINCCFNKDFSAGVSKIPIVWEDNEVNTGKHFYVIEVPGVLITSPIHLNVQKPAPVTLQVIETYPADGATNIPIDIDMWFRFSEPVDIRSFIVPEYYDRIYSGAASPQVEVNWLNIIIEPTSTIRSYGGPVFAQYDPKNEATAAWFMISWDPNTTYTVRLKTGIKSQQGIPLANDYVFRFTTGNWRKWDAGPREVTADTGSKNRLEKIVLGKPSVEQKLGIDSAQIPKFVTNIFDCYDWAWIYFQFVNVSKGDHKLELNWYDPSGNIFLKQNQPVKADEESMKSEIAFWRWPGILGDPLGKYKIEILWDGQKIKIVDFERR